MSAVIVLIFKIRVLMMEREKFDSSLEGSLAASGCKPASPASLLNTRGQNLVQAAPYFRDQGREAGLHPFGGPPCCYGFGDKSEHLQDPRQFPKRPRKHKDLTSHDFWNPPSEGPSKQHRILVCMCFWGRLYMPIPTKAPTSLLAMMRDGGPRRAP